MIRWIRDRFWSHCIVAWMLMVAIVGRRGDGPHLGLDALPLAVIASWAWALHADSDLRRDIAEGFQAQHQTWNRFLRGRPPLDPSPLYTAVLHRMHATETYLHTIARRHRVQRLTVAFADSWSPLGHPHEAASIRQGRRAHIWLGSNWLGPDDTEHLPVILEHELGHILRRDNQRATALKAAGILLMVLAAAWLALPTAILVTVGLWLLNIIWSWWSELACDARAARLCGRDAVIALWERNTALQHDTPAPVRLWNSARSATTHPPYRLRLWWARHVSASAAVPHPLATPPEAQRERRGPSSAARANVRA